MITLQRILRKIGLMASSNELPPGSGQPKKNDGKRPGEGPPDLDQMWRDFTARLGRIFGGKGGPGGFKPDSRGTGIGAAIITVVLLLLWILSGYFIVPEGQTAVVTTFGKMAHTAGVGINWRWPYPIQNSELVNMSEAKIVEIGAAVSKKPTPDSLMLTEDANMVGVQMTVQYKVKDAFAWLFNNSENESSVKQVGETALRAAVGQVKMDAILYGGHDKLAADIQNAMQQMLDRYKSGVQVTGVSILATQPPEQVQAAFDDVVKASQERERMKNEGLAFAAESLPKATSTAARLAQESDAYRTNVVDRAEGDAARFKQVLTEYQKAPAVTRDRMYLDTMQQIFTNTTKVMVDAKAGSSLIYLPIDKLLAQSINNENGSKGTVTISNPTAVPNASSSPASNATAPEANAPADASQAAEVQRTRDSRSRDTRDREGR